MAKELSNEKGKGARKEFPPTFDLQIGETLVAIALDQREVPTQYGDRLVVESVIRGMDPATAYTLWWPRKLPTPPLKTPFRLERLSKAGYKLVIPESDDEQSALWNKGRLDGDPAAAATGPRNLVPLKYQETK